MTVLAMITSKQKTTQHFARVTAQIVDEACYSPQWIGGEYLYSCFLVLQYTTTISDALIGVPFGNTIYGRFSFRRKSGTSDGPVTLFTLYQDSAPLLCIVYNTSTSVISVVRPLYDFNIGTPITIASAASSLDDSDWHVIEFYVLLDSTNGEVEIRIDGTAELTYSGPTLFFTAHTGMTSVAIAGTKFGAITAFYYFDDVVLRDDTWCGTGAVWILPLKETISNTGWSPVPETNDLVDCIKAPSPLQFDQYIIADARPAVATATFSVDASHAVGMTNISAIAANLVLSSGEVGAAGIKHSLLSGSAEVATRAIIDVGSNAVQVYYPTNPDDDAAWESADLAALQIALEVV